MADLFNGPDDDDEAVDKTFNLDASVRSDKD